MPPTPNYSEFTIKQLYAILRNGDLEGFPEKIAAVKREIKVKGGNPNVGRRDDSLKSKPIAKDTRWLLSLVRRVVKRNLHPQPTPALKLVRGLVAMEFGGAVLVWIYYFLSELMKFDLVECMMLSIQFGFVAFVCWIGVAAMRIALQKVPDKVAVEIAWLSALGLAPLCLAGYLSFGMWLIFEEKVNVYFAPLLLLIPFSFYLPFVLLTGFLKYRYREDEF